MNDEAKGRLSTLWAMCAILALWELEGRVGFVASGALPAPSAVLTKFWIDRSDYGLHAWATARVALLGFLAGNLVAVIAALAYVRWPATERLTRGINIALFALPPIAIVPILVIALPGDWPGLVLAAVAVYFPTMTAMLAGLSEVDRRVVDVVRVYGGGESAVMRWVRLRAGLPALLGGMRVAGPAAVLGAILAEFGSGSRWGLGSYLLGSIGSGDASRLWGIGLTATAMAGLAYGAAALVSARMTGATRAVTMTTSLSLQPAAFAGRNDLLIRVGAVVLPFAVWWLLLVIGQLSPIIAKTPFGVFDYLFLSPGSPKAQTRILAALAETLPLTLLGMAAGLFLALLLAMLGSVKPALAQALLPVALVTQTMPLVALTPLLVLIFGRGTAVTLAITVSVTFFPSFVVISHGLALVPKAAFELVRAYGASRMQELRLISLPAAQAWLFAAARLAVPRALLGVMIAEWLATGKGLGNLLNQSRGYLDYGMIWSVALVAVLVSIGLYQALLSVERLISKRQG